MISEIHNLEMFNPSKIEIAYKIILDWYDRSVKEIHRKNNMIWLEGFILNTRNEFFNAMDCLWNGDLKAATLQLRYSTLFLMSFILYVDIKIITNAPSKRLIQFLQSKLSFGSVIQFVMSFTGEEKRLKKYLKVLTKKL